MSLSLKIKISGATKTMQLSGDMSVHEVCKEIKEKFDGAGGADHGLFFPGEGKWLIPSKVLDFYDFKSGDLLEYKKKHRPLKFRTMDDSIKTVIVDETLPVSQLVVVVCQRIGLSNTEEYSFQPEATEKQKEAVKKGKDKIAEAIADDARWLNPDKTLAEQGLTESDIVILKKKFYFTDQNIDRNDPVQLNLLYNQAREGILTGKHPCTVEEAAQFAAIQCQVQFGNHEEGKHKPGLKDFIPSEYQKEKDMDKKIFKEHKKLQGLTELNAKFRYVQLSRSLKTYGITFFLVKERVGKKNKLIPVLMGVTKNSVVKLDMETKDITKEWKLTQLRRWAASPTSFTLDFGDYSDAYYSVQTNEGEQISQLIAGYIDIILKKRKEAEKIVPEEEIEQSSVEEYIKPGKATNVVGVVSNGHRTAAETNVQAIPIVPVIRPGMYPANGFATMFNPHQQNEHNEMQENLFTAIRNGLALLKTAVADMNVATQLPPLGTDAASVSWKNQTIEVNASNISNYLASQLAAVGSLLNNATGITEQMDYEVLTMSVNTLTSNLNQLSQSIKLIAALNDDNGDSILNAARAVANAMADLLSIAQPIATGDSTRKKEMFNVAQQLSILSYNLLSILGRIETSDDAEKDILAIAAALAKAVGELVQNARTVSKSVSEEETKQMIVSDAKFTFETCQQLVACVKTVLPTITIQLCADQVTEGAVLLRDAVDMLANSCSAGQDENSVLALNESANNVDEILATLVDKASKSGQYNYKSSDELDNHYDTVLDAVDKMISGFGKVEEIISNAKELTLSATHYVTSLKNASKNSEHDEQKDALMNTAKNLAEYTSRMVACAKDAARFPDDAQKQKKLQNAVEEIRNAVSASMGSKAKTRALNKLAKTVKDVIASSNQLISSAKLSSQSNRNQTAQMQLNQAARKVNEINPLLISALKMYQNSPTDLVAQVSLIKASKQAISPGIAFIMASKSAASTVGDITVHTQLVFSISKNEEDLRILEKSFRTADELKAENFQIESALDSIKHIQSDLNHAQYNSAQATTFTPELVQSELFTVATSIQQSIALLVNSAGKGNEKQTGEVTTDAVMALQALSMAAQGFAANENDLDLKAQMLGAASGVADTISSLILAAKNVQTGENIDREAFNTLIANASVGLDYVVGCLPGQKELDRTISFVAKHSENISDVETDHKTTEENRDDLHEATAKFSHSTSNLPSAIKSNVADLKIGLEDFETVFLEIVLAAKSYAEKIEDAAVSRDIELFLNDFGTTCGKLLQIAKAMTAEKDNYDIRDDYIATNNQINSKISELLKLCSENSVGQTECINALENLMLCIAKLNSLDARDPGNPSESYGECLNGFSDNCKSFIMALSNLNTFLRSGDKPKLATKILEISNILTKVTDSTSRAAYLVGISHVDSIPSVDGIIDQTLFSQCGRDIVESCKVLGNPNNTQSQIFAAAATIAKQTNALCIICKNASQNSNISEASRQMFFASSKTIASNTAALVSGIKVLASRLDSQSRKECQETSAPLLETIGTLLLFGNSPEFAGSKGKVSQDGVVAQRPLVERNKNLINAVEKLTKITQAICAESKEDDISQEATANIKQVTEGIQVLAKTIAASTPGIKQIDEAIQKVSEIISTVDHAIVEATMNSLEQTSSASSENLLESIKAFNSLIELIGTKGTKNVAQLVSSLVQLPLSFSQIVEGNISLASLSMAEDSQIAILDDTKNVSDLTLSFLYSLKKVVGSSKKNEAALLQLETEKNETRAAFGKLLSTLEGTANDFGEYQKYADRIELLLASDTKLKTFKSGTLQNFVDDIQKSGRIMADVVSDIITKTKTPEHFLMNTSKLCDLLNEIYEEVLHADESCEDHKVKQKLVNSARDLLGNSLKLMDTMRLCSGKSTPDQISRANLTQAARDVTFNISNVVANAKEGLRSMFFCQESIDNIDDFLSDLESAILFAEAGQLDPTDSSETYIKNKDALLFAAKSLTENVKEFITTVTGTREELGNIAKKSVLALQKLKDSLKKGAASITSSDRLVQQNLLNSGKLVAETHKNLINAASNAQGKSANDPAISEFNNILKKELATVSEMIKVIRAVGDEGIRSSRAIEACIYDVGVVVDILLSDKPAQGTALPEEIIQISKQLANASSRFIRDVESRPDAVAASGNILRKHVDDLARATKAATENAPWEAKKEVIVAVSEACKATQYLLQTAIAIPENVDDEENDGGKQVQEAARKLAASISAVTCVASSLIPGGYVDNNDPDVVAERELLAAANAIESAAKKLQMLKSINSMVLDVSEENFEGQILEAAKAIAAAAAALIRSATSVQREIAAQGKTGNKKDSYHSDGTWIDGLVTGAKEVVFSTQELCDAAKKVKVKADRDRVIIAARSVSASTAQLIHAATVKADPNSSNQIKLKAAAKAVMNATTQLVNASEDAQDDEELDIVATDASTTKGKVLEMEAQMSILKMEKELEQARKKLSHVRKTKYTSASKDNLNN